ncbi:hypothetical protein EVAR_46055_1 [Eumeta japonica]|uniref:Uncharacterized protein n=1 Tax=Eumeta variegata TaxID=151549 RepID=A0A4C2ACC7_EUMVA|nr:hypothetical protein EVAR_46055_1 [Eumeta japonica]
MARPIEGFTDKAYSIKVKPGCPSNRQTNDSSNTAAALEGNGSIQAGRRERGHSSYYGYVFALRAAYSQRKQRESLLLPHSLDKSLQL